MMDTAKKKHSQSKQRAERGLLNGLRASIIREHEKIKKQPSLLYRQLAYFFNIIGNSLMFAALALLFIIVMANINVHIPALEQLNSVLIFSILTIGIGISGIFLGRMPIVVNTLKLSRLLKSLTLLIGIGFAMLYGINLIEPSQIENLLPVFHLIGISVGVFLGAFASRLAQGVYELLGKI